MITFLDGPAARQKLNLARAPMFLRVVCDPTGKWDALDQLSDTPRDNETLYVYRLDQREGSAFVDGRDPKTGKRWGCVMQMGTYKHHPEQPDDATMRDRAAWVKWCAEAGSKLLGRPIVVDEDGRMMSVGTLAIAAGEQPTPEQIAIASASEFRWSKTLNCWVRIVANDGIPE